jgi:hypothetical protein
MSWLQGIVVELIVFGLIWAGWSYFTRNLRAFFELRERIRGQLRAMETASAGTGEMRAPAGVAQNPEQAAETCRRLGYEMLALVEAAPIAARLARFMLFDPLRAGDHLVSLSYDGSFAFRRNAIAAALLFRSDSKGLSTSRC